MLIIRFKRDFQNLSKWQWKINFCTSVFETN